MDQPFRSGSACLSGYPFGRLDMHGMKRLLSMLDVKTDCIHHTVSASKGVGDGPIVVDVGLDRLKLRIIKTKQLVPPIGMPGCNPYGKAVPAEAPRNATAEEPGSAEHSDGALVSRRHDVALIGYQS
jgi:hypothetical protein